METEKPSYYAIIPAEVRYDHRLKANEKLLYGEVTALCSSSGECWASNKFFAELYDVHITNVSRWVNSLVDKGYLESQLVYKEGTKEIEKRVLRLSSVSRNVKTPHSKNVKTSISKNAKENNTSINNTSMNNNILSSNLDDTKGKAVEIIDYLNEKAGKRFSHKTKETAKHINARLKDGYTVDDFKRVIDNRVMKWARDKKMKEYIRPDTLFTPTNFEKYFNDALDNLPDRPPVYKPSMSEEDAKALLEKGDITSWME